jgi:hypothetical protein
MMIAAVKVAMAETMVAPNVSTFLYVTGFLRADG